MKIINIFALAIAISSSKFTSDAQEPDGDGQPENVDWLKDLIDSVKSNPEQVDQIKEKVGSWLDNMADNVKDKTSHLEDGKWEEKMAEYENKTSEMKERWGEYMDANPNKTTDWKDKAEGWKVEWEEKVSEFDNVTAEWEEKWEEKVEEFRSQNYTGGERVKDILEEVGARNASACAEVTTDPAFDLESFKGQWFAHEQQDTLYTTNLRGNVRRDHCVTAYYDSLDTPTKPWGYTIAVDNYAEDAAGNAYGGMLYAKQEEGEAPGKLIVAPKWMPSAVAGPYWVLAQTEEYALVSGGRPNIPTEGGLCKMSSERVNGAGLWVFLRSRERNEALVAEALNKAQMMGIDTSDMYYVNQVNCRV